MAPPTPGAHVWRVARLERERDTILEPGRETAREEAAKLQPQRSVTDQYPPLCVYKKQSYEVSPTREKCGSRKKLEDLSCSGGEEPPIFVYAAPPVTAIR